jgi:hypothetical protein
LLFGRGTVGGLVPANFPPGSTRYLDVTQGGVRVLAARLPLYASAFSVSPGPQGPPGPQGGHGATGSARTAGAARSARTPGAAGAE